MKLFSLGKDRSRELQQAKNAALLDSLGEGIVVTDKNGNVELINREAEVLVGWKLKEVVGKKWYEVAPLVDEKGNRIAPEKRATQVVLQTGKARSNDTYYYVRRDGTKFAVGTTASPVILEGKTVGVIAVFRDITREREVNEAKNEFVSLASHQLRTPLSAIKWFAEMLLAGDAGKLLPEQIEYLRNINISNERMIQLVNSLLNISRIESGRIIVDPVPTDLGRLIYDVVKGLEVKTKEKDIQIAISVLPSLPKISIDPKMMSQVYMNLLTNAIKYSSDKGQIMITVSQKNSEIVSQITDNGYGIPESEQHRVFEKFYRGSNVVTTITDGTGLGLYLVKAIVQSSRGKIWFKSVEGKGTTFWFTLPISGMTARSGEVVLT